jgi:protein-L-isoaspartate(D-aspartate) O-methyltransferase
MHAHAATSLLPFLKPGARVLDVGSGSGYLTHVLANLVGERGRVVGVEHIQELVDMGRENMRKSEDGRAMLDRAKVRFVLGDGRKGWTGDGGEEGWDVIHVGAAAVTVHEELVQQLRSPGR